MKRKKNTFILVTCLAVACALVGCGKTKEPAVAPTQETQAPTEVTEEPEEKTQALQPGVYQYSFTEEIAGENAHFYHYLVIKDDHTGFYSAQDFVPLTWDEKEIVCSDTHYPYTVEEQKILLEEEFGTSEFALLEYTTVEDFIENYDNPEYIFSLEMENIPSSFVEEVAEKTSFADYDEIISYLTKGQGYAYAKLIGCDKELLLITDMTYDNLDGNMASINAFVYGPNGDAIEYMGMETSDGTAYPIRVGDGVIYAAGNHSANGEFCTEDGIGLMAKLYAYEAFDEDGTASYGGFERKTNSFDDENERDISTEEEYQELYNKYFDAEIVNFTVIK